MRHRNGFAFDAINSGCSPLHHRRQCRCIRCNERLQGVLADPCKAAQTQRETGFVAEKIRVIPVFEAVALDANRPFGLCIRCNAVS